MEFTMIETGWLSILPPLIAIVLALITKEVYSLQIIPVENMDDVLFLCGLTNGKGGNHP